MIGLLISIIDGGNGLLLDIPLQTSKAFSRGRRTVLGRFNG